LKNLDFLKKHGYTDEQIALYLDAMFDNWLYELGYNNDDDYWNKNYPTLVATLKDTDALNRIAIHHLAKLVINEYFIHI